MANTSGVDSYQQDECGLHRMRVGSLFDTVTVLVLVLTDKQSHQIDLQHLLLLIERDVDLDSEGWAETPVSSGGDSALAGRSAPGAECFGETITPYTDSVDLQACSWSANDGLFISIMFLCWPTPAHKKLCLARNHYSS